MKAVKMSDGFVMLTPEVSKALISIRENVERKETHQGKNKEIAQAAFNEIALAHGNHPKRFEGCTGCWGEGNRILINWFKMYDERGKTVQIQLNPPTVKKLQPIQRDLEDQIKEEEGNKLKDARLNEAFFDEGIHPNPEGMDIIEEEPVKSSKEIEIVDLDKLDLEGLRAECERRGIKYHHKNKEATLRKKLQ